MRFFFHASAPETDIVKIGYLAGYPRDTLSCCVPFFGNKWRQTKLRDGYDRNVGTRKLEGKNVKFGLLQQTMGNFDL